MKTRNLLVLLGAVALAVVGALVYLLQGETGDGVEALPEDSVALEGVSASAAGLQAEEVDAERSSQAQVLEGSADEGSEADDPVDAIAPITHSRLAVVDSVTGVHLKAVLVLRHAFNAGYGVYPNGWGPQHVVHAAADSPLRLERGGTRARFWLHAPGYTWASTFLSFEEGEDRVVQLEANGGRVRVSLSGELTDPAPHVRLYTGGEEHHAAERLPEGGVAELRGIPAGDYEVRVEQGPARSLRGQAAITVTAGGETSISVSVSAASESLGEENIEGVLLTRAQDDELVLTVHGPGEPFEQQASVLTSMKEYSEEVGGYAFRVDGLRQGAYMLIVQTRWASMDVDVQSGGLRNVRMQLPDVVPVRVSVVDNETELPIATRGLNAGVVTADGAVGMSRPVRSTLPNQYELNAPLGTLELVAGSNEYSRTPARYEISHADQEIVLRLRKQPGFWLRLTDGEVPVPFGFDTPLRIWHEEHGEGERRYADGSRVWVSVPAPGEYTLEMGEVAGFRPIPPLVVPVTWEGQTAFDFALERK